MGNKEILKNLLSASPDDKQKAIKLLKGDFETRWELPMPKNVPIKSEAQIKADAKRGLFWH